MQLKLQETLWLTEAKKQGAYLEDNGGCNSGERRHSLVDKGGDGGSFQIQSQISKGWIGHGIQDKERTRSQLPDLQPEEMEGGTHYLLQG